MNSAQTVPMFGEDNVSPELRPFIDVLLNGDGEKYSTPPASCPKDADERGQEGQEWREQRHSNQQPSE